MKPHIIKLLGQYMCSGQGKDRGYIGFGPTPKIAYFDLKRKLQDRDSLANWFHGPYPGHRSNWPCAMPILPYR